MPFKNADSGAVDEESVVAFPRAPVKPGFNYNRSDQGNADYFVDLFGDRIRYDHNRNRWLVWHRHRWQEDRKGVVREAAQRAAHRQLKEARQMPSGSTDQNGKADAAALAKGEAIRWALKSQSRASRESTLSTVKDRAPISMHSVLDGWDADPWLLGVPNGVVDLLTGELRGGQRDTDKITLNTRVPFDPTARCPRWERFLEEISVGDPELVAYFRRACGYMLTGDVREDCWFAPTGEGQNGKTTFLTAWFDILGDYAFAAPFSLVQQGESKRFHTAYLQHKRFVVLSEVSKGAVIDDAMLKLLTGKDAIPAEWKHGDSFEFHPSHKLWFMFNNKPTVKDTTHGFWRRARIIPFSRRFDGAVDDKGLKDTLRAEYPGIFAWAVRACLE